MESRTSRSSSPIDDRALASGRSAFGAWSRWRRLDAAAAALVLLSVGYLILRNPLPGRHDLIGTGLLPDMGSVLLGAAVVLPLALIPRHERPRSRLGLRMAAWFGVTVLAGMALSRFLLAHHEATSDEVWPPRVAIAERDDVSELPQVDQTEWALRLALHAAGTVPTLDQPPSIPASWPWPDAVVLATRDTEAGTEVWSHYPGSDVSCHAVLAVRNAEPPERALIPTCSSDPARPAGLAFTAAVRVEEAPRPIGASIGAGWPQHRLDARRTGVSPAGVAAVAGWRRPLHTPIRASASVVGERVLVGGHATGLVASIHLATGELDWVTRVPNWVHQEPVSDGALVVVGFGDNKRSFLGRAPSGVAALDPVSGQRHWTAFDESSVMTSPILTDSLVVYATAAGLLKARSRATGEIRGVATLPGGVIMGPPVAHGDTLIATLDIDQVCAYLISTLRQLWCRELPWLRMVGHSSAAIADGMVVLSAAATARSLGPGDLRHLRAAILPSLARSVLFPRYWDIVHSGQVLVALRLDTGERVWRSRFFPRRREVDGHTAGTPVLDVTGGFVVLPIADRAVAFEPATGVVRWVADAHGSRGPALVVEGGAVVAGRDGTLEVREMPSGEVRCASERATGWDRAGPALAGGFLVLADLQGVIEAIPAADLLACN